MRRDTVWSLLFSVAVAVLMLAVLLSRSTPTPIWVLIVYPGVGAALGQIASRTSPAANGIARLETWTIAAASTVVLVLLVDVLLAEWMISGNVTWLSQSFLSHLALPVAGVLLWWALERRLTRLRKSADAAESTRADRYVELSRPRKRVEHSAQQTDQAA